MIKILKNLSVYKWIVLLVFGLVFIQSMADLFLPTLMADIIDKGVVVGDIPYIWKIGGLMLVVSALGALRIMLLRAIIHQKRQWDLGGIFVEKVFNHVESFSLQDFDEVGTASLITRTTNDITQVQQVVIMMLRMVISAPIMFVGGLIMAFQRMQNYRLSLLRRCQF